MYFFSPASPSSSRACSRLRLPPPAVRVRRRSSPLISVADRRCAPPPQVAVADCCRRRSCGGYLLSLFLRCLRQRCRASALGCRPPACHRSDRRRRRSLHHRSPPSPEPRPFFSFACPRVFVSPTQLHRLWSSPPITRPPPSTAVSDHHCHGRCHRRSSSSPADAVAGAVYLFGATSGICACAAAVNLRSPRRHR
jgi:hypothetical protein